MSSWGKTSRVALAVLALGLGAGACADRATGPYATSSPPGPLDSTLAVGDVFEVRVYKEPELSAVYVCGEDGAVNYPHLQKVRCDGKKATDIELDIQTRLAEGYIKHPSVSVVVKEWRSRKISVLGQVANPGTFAYTANMSIVEAVTTAGGFTAMARKNSVLVTRRETGAVKRISVAVDDIGKGKAPPFYLRPGDTIFIDERLF